MEWIDGDNRAWSVVAHPEAVTLRSGNDELLLPREDWQRDLYAARLRQRVIVRFQGQDFEVGFLVGPEQAHDLFARIGYDPLAAADEITARPASQPRTGPIWPKVTHSSVWALIFSALAFLPKIGLLFGLVAIALVLVFRARHRTTAAMAHARVMCTVALGFAIVGMAISLLAAYSAAQMAERMPTGAAQSIETGWKYSYGAIVAAILVVVLSLSVHECGHAISAWWCGDDLARSLGRVTLNPLAHIDLFGTVLLPILLAVSGAPVFGYARPVPVRLGSIRRYRRAHILISLAGPGANLLLAAVSLALHLAIGSLLSILAPNTETAYFSSLAPYVRIEGVPGGQVLAALVLVLKLSFMINLFLAAFNLIPIPPLDGSWVLEHLFPKSLGRVYAAIRPYGFLLFLALIWTGAFEYLVIPVFVPLLGGLLLVHGFTGL